MVLGYGFSVPLRGREEGSAFTIPKRASLRDIGFAALCDGAGIWLLRAFDGGWVGKNTGGGIRFRIQRGSMTDIPLAGPSLTQNNSRYRSVVVCGVGSCRVVCCGVLVLFLSCRVLCSCGIVLVVSCVVLFVLCVCVCGLFLFLQYRRGGGVGQEYRRGDSIQR